MRAAVIVVGDLGRSPRMQYHARALATAGIDVDLIGYEGTALPQFLVDPRIQIHRFAEAGLRHRIKRSKILYGLLAMIDAVRASIRLSVALMKTPRPDLLLVQSPPALPTLQVAWVVSRLRRARLVIDWHNLGYTILALRLGRRHFAVRLARWLEMLFARSADAHLCVSRGFSKFLAERFQLKDSAVHPVRVPYDRPASSFTPIDRVEREQIRQALFVRLGIRNTSTLGFLVCPTGWTEDEDF